MITIYNRIDKSMDDTSGAQVVPSVEYLERPFLLCLSPNNSYEKSVFGVMRSGAQAARLLTPKDMAARFKQNDFPIDILGIKFHTDLTNHEKHEEIADKLLFPFITKYGFDFNSMFRQARKVNVFTFNDGIYTYKDTEDRLIALLKKYVSYDEMEKIMANISLVAFNDVNDLKIKSLKQDSYQKLLTNHEYDSLFAPLGESNGILYIYEGTGIHSVKEFYRDTAIVKPALASVVTYFLENSLENMDSRMFIPLSIDTIMKRLFKYADESKTIKELLEELDDTLYYNGAPRYSLESAPIRMELDRVYKLLKKTNDTFIRSLGDKKDLEKRLNTVISKMREYCSDITFQQILTSSNMWKPKSTDELFSKPTDKTIRSNYNEK